MLLAASTWAISAERTVLSVPVSGDLSVARATVRVLCVFLCPCGT